MTAKRGHFGRKKRRIQVFEDKCLRKFLDTFYWEYKTNVFVRKRIENFVGDQEPLFVKTPARSSCKVTLKKMDVAEEANAKTA